MQVEANELLNELAHFTGDLERYRAGLSRSVIYTPGVRHVAERAGAYWLIDAIVSHVNSRKFYRAVVKDARIGSMHF